MRTSDFGAPLLDGELIASEEHCISCTQWGVQSAAITESRRHALVFRHRRCTKPAGDATATTWPSRVLLLVERRGGASRASCAMELIPSDAADTRNRRWRAVGEQQHCSGARTATPCWQAFQRVFVVAESDWVGARASSWVHSKALVAYITATATEKGRASQRFFAN